MFLDSFFFIILLVLIPTFSMFVQTIKNLILFVVLVGAVIINMMLTLGLEFFPVFFALIYVGAIIVSILFMVLTFDLRSEYVKQIFSDKFTLNVILYFIATPIFYYLITEPKFSLWKFSPLDRFDRVAAYHDCRTLIENTPAFCERAFGFNLSHKSLYHQVGERVSDIVVISDNLYTTYALLFIILGLVLTLALVAALTIIKKKVTRDVK